MRPVADVDQPPVGHSYSHPDAIRDQLKPTVLVLRAVVHDLSSR